MQNRKINLAFTLIELLVVISIIGVLIALSLFGIQGARQSSRDAKRKSDLETIRSALEMYKADVGGYPLTADLSFGGQFAYLGNVYLELVPNDVLTDRNYSYFSNATAVVKGTTYTLCAALEGLDPGNIAGCDCEDVGCNYQVKNP